jgi:glycosyltransferase involved in cell wall biosynthesis
MKKNVWYISKYATPLKYGFGSRHFYLAGELNKLGWNTVVISSDSNHLSQFPDFGSLYSKESIDGVETWWIKTLKYKGSASFRRILSWIDFEIKFWFMPKNILPKPDIVIISSLSLLTILNGFYLKKKYGCKLVFEIRDIWPLTLTEEGGYSNRNPFVMFLAWVEKFGYRKSDAIVGTMPNLSEHVKEVTGKALHCHCVPFGYLPGLYDLPEPLPDGYEERYIPKNRFIVGYAGSIGRTNALDTFMDCAFEMNDDPRVHFLLLGDGDLLEEYKAKVVGRKNISFAPKVKKEQVQSVLRHCDVLYFSVEESRVWRYGQSLNKLIDYMSAGKPIIGSYNGYPSMLNEARCGKFVPVKDARALAMAIHEYERLPTDELESIGKRGKDWLLEHRPYDKLAIEYRRILETGLCRNEATV